MNNIPEEALFAPIKISDAVSKFYKKISKNARPYDQVCGKYFNSLLGDWEKDVLMKISDEKGCVKTGQVHSAWMIYLQGRELLKFHEDTSLFPEFPEEVVKKWINIFKNSSMEELCNMGTDALEFGWQILAYSFQRKKVNIKWENVYSKSVPPKEWLSLANDNLVEIKKNPYGLADEDIKEMEEKYYSFKLNLPK